MAAAARVLLAALAAAATPGSLSRQRTEQPSGVMRRRGMAQRAISVSVTMVAPAARAGEAGLDGPGGKADQVKHLEIRRGVDEPAHDFPARAGKGAGFGNLGVDDGQRSGFDGFRGAIGLDGGCVVHG